jgi:hypothetical protein
MSSMARKRKARNVERVTKIIGSVFPFPIEHIPEGVLKASQDFGNCVHKMVELYLKGTLNLATLDPVLAKYLEQFKKWQKDTKFQIMGFEEKLISKKYNYSGTPDIFGKYKNRLAIVDLKTTSTLSKTLGLQLSGYELLVKEKVGGNVTYCDRYVLRLYLEKYVFFQIKGTRDMSVFLACLAINNFRRENGYVVE